MKKTKTIEIKNLQTPEIQELSDSELSGVVGGSLISAISGLVGANLLKDAEQGLDNFVGLLAPSDN